MLKNSKKLKKEGEIWIPIRGYKNLYKVSNFGRVLSLARKTTKGGILKTKKSRNGYLVLTLCKKGIKKSTSVHSLVANNFLKKTKTKNQVNHKNGDKSNNKVENLEWVTAQENKLHSLRNGTSPTKKIIQIDINNNTVIKEWPSIISAAIYFNINPSCIIRACKGITANSAGFNWSYVKRSWKT